MPTIERVYSKTVLADKLEAEIEASIPGITERILVCFSEQFCI